MKEIINNKMYWCPVFIYIPLKFIMVLLVAPPSHN